MIQTYNLIRGPHDGEDHEINDEVEHYFVGNSVYRRRLCQHGRIFYYTYEWMPGRTPPETGEEIEIPAS